MPGYTVDGTIGNVSSFISAGGGYILLEHDVREVTVQLGRTISGMISKAGQINVPVAAVMGDAQRYQKTNLRWPIVGPNGFDVSINPLTEVGSDANAVPPPVNVSR